MSSKDKENQSIERDPDFVNSEIAIKRAANRARETARQKGSYIVIYRDGEIVKVRMDKDVA